MVAAKIAYSVKPFPERPIGIDTPTPYRISDLFRQLDNATIERWRRGIRKAA